MSAIPVTVFDCGVFLQGLISKAGPAVEKVPLHFRFIRDVTDEPYLNLAIETRAELMVSRDKDLLDLMTSPSIEAKEFRQRFRFLKIVDPVAFLRIIRPTDLPLAAE